MHALCEPRFLKLSNQQQREGFLFRKGGLLKDANFGILTRETIARGLAVVMYLYIEDQEDFKWEAKLLFSFGKEM